MRQSSSWEVLALFRDEKLVEARILYHRFSHGSVPSSPWASAAKKSVAYFAILWRYCLVAWPMY